MHPLAATAAHRREPDRPAEDVRARLLAEGLRLFAQQGYNKTSTRELTEAASVNIASISYFIRIPGYCSGAEDRVAVFDATGSARKWLAVHEGGSHSLFTDRGGTGGVTLNPQVKEATRTLALAFVHTVFDGDDAALRLWPQRHAAILARFSAGQG